MNYLCRWPLLIILLTSLVATQCTFTSTDSRTTRTGTAETVPLEDFAEDTVLINKYHKLALSYLFQDANKAMFYSKYVLRLSQKHNWGKGKVLAYNLLSTFYLIDGSYDVLRELSNETLILSKQLDMPLYAAHAKRFMAESYSEYRQWDSARINYDQAISIFTALGADSARALTLENLANCYRENNKYDLAESYYAKSYLAFDKLNSDWGKAIVLQSRGYMNVRQAYYKEAEKYFNQSLELSKKLKSRYGELNTLNDLSNTHYMSREYDKAIDTGLRALEQAKIYHSNQQINWALMTLAKSYRAKGMLEDAFDYSQQVVHNRRMLHDEDVKRQYTMYQLMYENQEMDSAIQQKIISEQKTIQRFLLISTGLVIAFAGFLWFNNKKLRRKNAEIKEAMIQGQTIERKRVAAELHDHLGGTLASLNWYLYGIDKKVLSEEEQQIYDSVHQMVGAAYREVRSLSHNLMPAELEEHGLVMALQRLVSKLNENKNIHFTLNLSGWENRLNSKIEFELYSIILELTNNIIKHSGAAHGTIDLTENLKNITLVVSDDGNGMIEPAGQGIGLKNVKSRVESVKGKIQIINNENSGTKVEIEIPKVVTR
jgi:NarL family two-component system sensor histidine kinase LiaS